MILYMMKRILCFVIMVLAAGAAMAQEFQAVPKSWKWLDAKEVIFSYDGTFADSAAFVVDAKTGKQPDLFT